MLVSPGISSSTGEPSTMRWPVYSMRLMMAS